jgi:hypothetical protein
MKNTTTEFDWMTERHKIPEHTRETLVDYLTKGWEPGGFVTAMLAMDMERAVYAADMVNGRNMQQIARWIIEYCPRASWGDYETVNCWLGDKDGCRTRFAEQIEKEAVWNLLKDNA